MPQTITLHFYLLFRVNFKEVSNRDTLTDKRIIIQIISWILLLVIFEYNHALWLNPRQSCSLLSISIPWQVFKHYFWFHLLFFKWRLWLLDGRQYKVLFPVPLFGLPLFFFPLGVGLFSHSFEFIPVLLLLSVLSCHSIRLIVIEHMSDIRLFVIEPCLLKLTCHLKRLKTLIHLRWWRGLRKCEWWGFFKFSLLNCFSPRL